MQHNPCNRLAKYAIIKPIDKIYKIAHILNLGKCPKKGIVDNNAKSVLAVPGTIKRALTEMKDHTEMEQQKYDSALTRLNDKVFPKEEGKKQGMFGGWFGN